MDADVRMSWEFKANHLIRNKSGEHRRQLAGESHDALPGRTFRLGGDYRRDHSYQRAVRSIETNRVSDHVNLCEVFIGDTTAVRLVPIKDELFA